MPIWMWAAEQAPSSGSRARWALWVAGIPGSCSQRRAQGNWDLLGRLGSSQFELVLEPFPFQTLGQECGVPVSVGRGRRTPSVSGVGRSSC